jgi:dTDP-glucose pyrophosphorylase
MKPITLINNSDLSFIDIVKEIDQGGYGYVAIIDDTNHLHGIVTDGDVRRCLLNNKMNLVDVINVSPRTILDKTPNEEAIAQMRSLHLKHMPVVDLNNRLLRMVSLDENDFISKENIVVIMAGGLGKRLGELTRNIPKPMLRVGERPIMQHIIEQFRDNGYKKFVVSTSYKKEVIETYFEDGKKFGVSIDYVNETQRLGTAGALSLLSKDMVAPFFVINADVLSSVNYDNLLDAHINSQSSATMCVRQYSQDIPYGVIECENDGSIIDIREKPSYFFNINAGIYVLDPQTLDFVPGDTFYDMPQMFLDLKKNGHKIGSFTIDDYWIDIGKPQDYELAKQSLDFS